MKKNEFRKILVNRISPQEAEMLKTSDPGLYISDFNRGVCLRIIEDTVTDDISKVDKDAAEELEQELQAFLSKYMNDHHEAHKWIILSCLELTFVEEKPMHPQTSAHWFCKDGKYYCPSMEERSLICRYCVCEKAGDIKK